MLFPEPDHRRIYGFRGKAAALHSLSELRLAARTIAQVAVSRRQTALLFELAQKAGLTLKSPSNPDERGGMVVVEVPHAYEVSKELIARKIVIDFRPNASIRIAPHFYNTDDEVRLAVEAIQQILESGDWQKHADEDSFVM